MRKDYYYYHILTIIFYAFQTSVVYSWGSPEGTIGHTMIPKVNIYGSIESHQGNTWTDAENITIDGKYKQIQMFFKPEILPKKVLNPETHKEEINLTDDPNQYAQVKIDLEEVSSIEAVAHLVY